ncbi:uncharacterized protein BDZ99DRAFT_360876, partial [Mytilinidion resinicola]
APMIVLHKHGDVIFELGGGDGEPSARLLVASNILTMVSPVFRAMFTGGFAEGQDLSPSLPRVVPLPDDNKKAMELLCRILHFDTNAIPAELDMDSLVELTILCDKYDCATPFRFYGNVWVSALLPQACEKGFEELLSVTYGLDLPEPFMELT